MDMFFLGVLAGLAMTALASKWLWGWFEVEMRAENALMAFRAAQTSRTSSEWRVVLGFENSDAAISRFRVTERYKYLSKSRHPDNFGTTETFLRLTRAKDEALGMFKVES